MADYSTPLVMRNKMSFIDFKASHRNLPVEQIEYIDKKTGAVKHFLRCGTTTLYATPDTQAFMYDSSVPAETRAAALQFAECRKPDAADIDENYVPCIMKLGGKVVNSL